MHDDEICFENFDVVLPLGNYFGVSAQSTEQADSHELFGWTLTPTSHAKGVKPSANAATQQQEKARERPQVPTSAPIPAGGEDTMQKIMQKLLNDNERLTARVEELSAMKTTVERIESILSRLDGSVSALQHGVPASDPNFSPKLVYEDLSKQIRAMEDKFVQMEKHIEKQTSHIVAALPPPANGPIKIAVYVLVLVQVILGTAYIMYRKRTEEKSKFL